MSPMLVTLLILAVTIVLFLSEKVSPDLVALLVVVALGVTGVLTAQETFSGFSRSAVITIISIFILAEGLKRAGITDQVGALLLKIGGTQERLLIPVIMLFGVMLSLFMNNIAAAAVLLPAVMGAAHRTSVKPSKLLMPLAFATILGGMATLLTTTNIVASTLLRDQHLAGYGLLDFVPLGIPIVLLGTIYMLTLGRRLLPDISLHESNVSDGDLFSTYRLGERLARVKVVKGSYVSGKTVAQSALRETYGLNLVAIERRGQMLLSPEPTSAIHFGDVLLLEGRIDDVPWQNLSAEFEVLPQRAWGDDDLESPKIAVVETVLSPRSSLIGQTLQNAHFREKFGMVVLGIWRAGRPIRSGLATQVLQFGDALLMQGPRDHLNILRAEPDLIVMSTPDDQTIRLPQKSWIASLIFITTLALSSFFPLAVGEVMLGGALAMILAGLLNTEQAYRAVEWKSVFLVAGMLPMGIAITKTGLAAQAANWLVNELGAAGPLTIIAALFVLALLLTQVMNGAAVASIIIPISIQTSQALSLDPRSVVMAVALATSIAFITPLGHPVNVLVMAPGGYQFRDYLCVGLPLAVLLTILILLLLPYFWPFYLH